MDTETKKIQGENEDLKSLVAHPGWKIVRSKFSDVILDLQNAFNIDDENESKIILDLKARKMTTTALFDILRQIEGGASQVDENMENNTRSYVYEIK